MNRSVRALLILLGMIAGVMLIGCWGDDADDLTPLVVDTDSPLLLDEPEQGEHASGKKLSEAETENAACFVCHANYTEELLVAWHVKEDVACVQCHGKSYAHRNDENHTTAPDHMYAADAVVAMCKKCHPGHEIPVKKLEDLRKSRTDKPASEPVVCTDCHGKHRLARRSVRWNKTTGKLIPK